MFKLGLEKAEEPEIKLTTSAVSWKKQESSRKNICFCFIDYAKAFDCVDHNKLWKVLNEMGIPDHLNCHLKNIEQGYIWFQYTFYVLLIRQIQAGIRIARRNINNLRYADDNTLMTESEEKLNSLLMR